MHATFHLLTIPCGVFGFLAVYEHHNRHVDHETGEPRPVPNFYSVHSWMGLATMAMFGLQFTFGFLTFVVLLCCEKQTRKYRASFAQLHANMGVVTFVLAIGTACAGITQKVYATLGKAYSEWIPYITTTGKST